MGSRAPAHEGAPYLISFIGGGEEALKIGTAMMSAVIGQVSSLPLGVANFGVADDTGVDRIGEHRAVAQHLYLPAAALRQDVFFGVSLEKLVMDQLEPRFEMSFIKNHHQAIRRRTLGNEIQPQVGNRSQGQGRYARLLD